MKTVKIGAIFLVSVMALAGTSAAFALWYDYLHLDIDVQTGYIGLEWSIERCFDDEIAEKDYSKIWAELWDPFGWGNNSGLFLHVVNGYPCINYTCMFDVHCTGSIPVHIDAPPQLGDIRYTPPGSNETIIIGTISIVFWDADGEILDFPVQIHPQETLYGKIVVHYNNDLPQDEYIWHTCVSFMYYQYNEIPDSD